MKKEDLRIVFMGTPEFAVETLQRLVENGYNVVAVVTQPDKPVGRHGSVLQPSAVKQYAIAQRLPVLQPEKMKDPEFVEQLRSYRANLQVVVAFRMLPEVVWAMPEYGTFNVHAALLPQYRGAAPINWAVINGETETGVTTFFLDHDIDTGRIIAKKTFAIPDDADVEYVYDGLMHLGAQLCLETLDIIIAADGHPQTIAQEDSSLFALHSSLKPAPKIFKETCEIDWMKTAKQVYDFVRGLSPVPGAWTTLVAPDGRETVLKIYKARKTGRQTGRGSGSVSVDGKSLCISAGDELLEIVELQMAGKKRMAARDFLNGMKNIGEYRAK
jgi:methionyl-tRNA formyltransferase